MAKELESSQQTAEVGAKPQLRNHTDTSIYGHTVPCGMRGVVCGVHDVLLIGTCRYRFLESTSTNQWGRGRWWE